jgi:uncharacterized membrane protein
MAVEKSAHMDRAQHTIHRIEAFSDIVIGFCLAQLGIGLVLPKNATDMFSVWQSTTFFVTAFILVAVLWWLHHRTFTSFFVLVTPMVVMNFAMLCGLVLTLYFLESIVHIANLGQDPSRFFALFVFAFAFVYTLVGLMLLAGLLVRCAELPADEIRWGAGQLVSICLAVTFGLAVGTYLILKAHAAPFIAYTAIAVAVAIMVISRLFLRPWLADKAARLR